MLIPKLHFGSILGIAVVVLAVVIFRKQVLAVVNKVPFIGGPTGLAKINPAELV